MDGEFVQLRAECRAFLLLLELDFGFQGLKGAAFVLDADGFPLLYGFFEFAFYAFCDVLFILELRY